MPGNKNSGRKKKPTAIKVLEGNPGKRRLLKGEPKFSDNVKPPEFLTGDALDEWNRMAPELKANGLLTAASISMFTSYCLAWADLVEASRRLESEGHIAVTEKGAEFTSPWVGIQDKAFARIYRAAREFGMTPSSSADLGVVAKQPEESEFERKRKAKLNQG